MLCPQRFHCIQHMMLFIGHAVVQARDVNKATEYKAMARTFKAKAKA